MFFLLLKSCARTCFPQCRRLTAKSLAAISMRVQAMTTPARLAQEAHTPKLGQEGLHVLQIRYAILLCVVSSLSSVTKREAPVRALTGSCRFSVPVQVWLTSSAMPGSTAHCRKQHGNAKKRFSRIPPYSFCLVNCLGAGLQS